MAPRTTAVRTKTESSHVETSGDLEIEASNAWHLLGVVAFGGFYILRWASNLGIQIICIVIISQYSATHSGKGEKKAGTLLGNLGSLHELFMHALRSDGGNVNHLSVNPSFDSPSSSSCDPSLDFIPSFVLDPPAAVFFNAVMIYGSLVLLSLDKSNAARHNDYAFIFGIVIGLLASSLASWKTSHIEPFKDYLPVTITTSLALSRIWKLFGSFVDTMRNIILPRASKPPRIGVNE